MSESGSPTGGVVIVSRCAWTLFNFRRNLAQRIQQQHAPVVTVGAPMDGFEEKLADEGIAFEPAPVPLKGLAPIGDAWLILQLFLKFRRLRPRIAHLFTIKPVIYGTLAAAAAGVPVRICTVTGLGHAFTEGGGKLRFIAETLYKQALKKAHIVFFQNPIDRAVFIERGLVDPDKAQLVAGSGVSLSHFESKPFRAGLAARKVRFLMLSRLIREKGVLEFIEAAERMTAAGVEAEFILAGAKDSRNPTALDDAELARLSASPVTWIGPLTDVRAALEEADVVVLPSYREGLPRSLLEAMAVGRPIITTDAPGCREVVSPGENGLSVPVRDAVALAEAMTYCAQHRERLEEMGAKGRKLAMDSFDEESIIRRTIAAYEEMTRDRR